MINRQTEKQSGRKTERETDRETKKNIQIDTDLAPSSKFAILATAPHPYTSFLGAEDRRLKAATYYLY